MIIDQLVQLWIFATGAASIWLVSDPSARHHTAGCWIGMAGQPAWYYTTFQHFQWGVFLLALVFTASYLRGIVNPLLKAKRP